MPTPSSRKFELGRAVLSLDGNDGLKALACKFSYHATQAAKVEFARALETQMRAAGVSDAEIASAIAKPLSEFQENYRKTVEHVYLCGVLDLIAVSFGETPTYANGTAAETAPNRRRVDGASSIKGVN